MRADWRRRRQQIDHTYCRTRCSTIEFSPSARRCVVGRETRPVCRHVNIGEDVYALIIERLRCLSARSWSRIPSKRVAGSAHRRNKSFPIDFTRDPSFPSLRTTVAAARHVAMAGGLG